MVGFSHNHIKYNIAAFEEIRRLPELDAPMTAAAESIAMACGPGYVAIPAEVGAHRTRAAVVTGEWEAIVDNAQNNTILNNIYRGAV